jgi:putative transposase
VKGRKRHIVVDSQGLLVRVAVHEANLQDKVGLGLVLRRVPLFARWQTLLLDGGYDSPALIAACKRLFDVRVEIVSRPNGSKGFVVIPKRWVVERTFAWLGRWRRLSKDYEQSPLMSEGFVYVASIYLLLRRLTC